MRKLHIVHHMERIKFIFQEKIGAVWKFSIMYILCECLKLLMIWPSGMHDAADPSRGCGGEVWCTREGATNHLAPAHSYNLHARQGEHSEIVPNVLFNESYCIKTFLPIVQCPPMAPVALEKLQPARGSRVWCSWGERSSSSTLFAEECDARSPLRRDAVTRDARCRDARRRDNSPSVENGWSALPVRLLGVRNYVNFILLTKWEVSKKFFLYCAWFFYLLIVAGDQRKGVKGRK